MRILSTLLLLAVCASLPLRAQQVTTSSNINLDGALQLANAARQEAAKLGKEATVAVLNASGVVVVVCKGDNVGPHNTEASRRKAYTAVSTKKSSLDFLKVAQSDPLAKHLSTIPDLLLLGGGVPLFYQGALVGAIGVSGAGGGEQDHQVAVEAAHKAGYDTVPKP